MFLRSTRWAASVLALGMSAATAVAQPPVAPPVAQPGPIPSSAAFPDTGDFQINHLYDDGGSLFDELDLCPRFRFQADYVFYTRQNRAKSLPVINGPDTFNTKDPDFNYNSGYRLTLGFMNDDFEFEGSYFDLNGLSASRSGTLANAVVFDGASVFNAGTTTAAARAVVGATPNFLESSTFFSPINTAANFSSVDPTKNELNELEYLDPLAKYAVRYDTSLQDFDFNLKGRRQSGRLLRFGVGYRNIQFNEAGSVALRGAFNTADTDGVETAPGVNDPNNGLSDTALTDTLTGGGLTGAGGFLETTPPTQLFFASSTRATNQLNGVQATMDLTFLESEYFQIGGYAKAGVYHNRARGSVSEIYQTLNAAPASSYTRSFSDSQNRVAFAGNLGVTGTFILRDNLRLFGGYELMYLSGVALAPDQNGGISTSLANVTSLNLQTHGQALFHGGRVGIEILFP